MPLVQRQADSGKITVAASEPATPLHGDLWYDTGDNELLSYNGSAFVSIGHDASETQTLTNKTVALGSNTVSGTTAQFNTANTDQTFATLAAAETLTNKTVNADNNTLSNLEIGSEVKNLKSFYELINPLTTNNKQRFIEWFSGNSLNTDRWTTYVFNSAPTFQMGDSVNGGFEIVTAASNNTGGGITFNNIARQYSKSGAVFICISQIDEASGETFQGLIYTHTTFNLFRNQTTISNINTEATMFTHTSDASADTQTATTQAPITGSPALFKIETKSSSVEFNINGVLDVTTTSTLPAEDMQPRFSVRALSAATHTGRIRYMECYNT